FGPECGAEGIDVAQCHGRQLALQLAGNGEVGGFPEEVLAVIHGPVGIAGRVIEIEGRYLEHLSGAFCVRPGDDGRVQVNETTLVEELVYSERKGGAHLEDGVEG